MEGTCTCTTERLNGTNGNGTKLERFFDAYCTCTYIYMYLYVRRTPQCTKEKKKTHTNTQVHYNWIPFPPHTCIWIKIMCIYIHVGGRMDRKGLSLPIMSRKWSLWKWWRLWRRERWFPSLSKWATVHVHVCTCTYVVKLLKVKWRDNYVTRYGEIRHFAYSIKIDMRFCYIYSIYV